MPTAAEHRAEAIAITEALDTLATVRARAIADRDDLGIRGGSTCLVRWSIDAAVAVADELGRLGAVLVDELHRRATLCERYTADLHAHRIAHRRWATAAERYRSTLGAEQPAPWPGAEPLPPVLPFAGAEAG